jgi:chromosome segregation ATPase
VSTTLRLPIPSAEILDRYGNGFTLAGVIYIHRISDKRFTGIARRNFGMFRELCGDKTLKNVVLVTNMWGEVSLDVGEAREEELVGQFFKPVLDKGAQIARHHNTVESAHDIIRHIMKNRSIALQIQRELVDEGMNLTDTAAGQAVNRELNEQIERHKAELRAVQEEMLRAQQRRDEETRRELEEETRKIQEEMNRMRVKSEEMAASYKEEKKRTEEAMRQMQEQARQDRERAEAEQRRQMDERNQRNEEKRKMEEAIRQMQEQARQEREQATAEHRRLVDEFNERNTRQERERAEAEQRRRMDDLGGRNARGERERAEAECRGWMDDPSELKERELTEVEMARIMMAEFSEYFQPSFERTIGMWVQALVELESEEREAQRPPQVGTDSGCSLM